MPDLALPLIGTEITIRAAVYEDFDAWYRLETDADVKRYVGGPVRPPRNEWISGMRGHIERRNLQSWVVALKAANTFAGRARLAQYDASSSDWEIQILIDKAHWGRGFGKEASELLIWSALRLSPTAGFIAVVHPENEASRRLVERLGFHFIREKASDDWQEGHRIYRLAPDDFVDSVSSWRMRPGA